MLFPKDTQEPLVKQHAKPMFQMADLKLVNLINKTEDVKESIAKRKQNHIKLEMAIEENV